MKTEIIPAILADSKREALKKIEAIKNAASWIQLDVMDGKFVPQKSWTDPKYFGFWILDFKLELHLMVQDPGKIIRHWLANNKYFRRAIWHIEAPVDHEKLIKFCRSKKLEVGLALAPETEAAAILPYADLIDEVLILGVRPGKSGQELIPATLKKISQIKKLAPRLNIGFDGHVDEKNAAKLVKLGVNRLYLASAMFKQKNVTAFFKKLQLKLRAQ